MPSACLVCKARSFADSVSRSAFTSFPEPDSKVCTIGATFGSNLGIVQTRQDFTNDMVNTLESGSGKLVNADLETESAKLLALQTRQALGIQSLSIANTSQQSILALFR
jgi:flagellin-like hook-associated protein FlgL